MWTTNLSTKSAPVDSKGGDGLKQNILNTICPRDKEDSQHPWYHAMSPYNFFRSRQVFMVPSHINVKQLSQIIVNQGVVLQVQGSDKKSVQENTLREVYDQFMLDVAKSERQNNILNLEFNMDSVFQN